MPAMDEVGFRLLVLWIYLALHVLFVRFVRADNPVVWFFNVVTGPLTRPVRALLPPGTPERRVRMVALMAYFICWMVVRAVFAVLVNPRLG
jgi:uncharacterized protein YggT (Ycf19 family)